MGTRELVCLQNAISELGYEEQHSRFLTQNHDVEAARLRIIPRIRRCADDFRFSNREQSARIRQASDNQADWSRCVDCQGNREDDLRCGIVCIGWLRAICGTARHERRRIDV